jgi:hypothetical protein
MQRITAGQGEPYVQDGLFDTDLHRDGVGRDRGQSLLGQFLDEVVAELFVADHRQRGGDLLCLGVSRSCCRSAGS